MRSHLLLIFILLLAGCKKQDQQKEPIIPEVLPSWQDGQVKQNIIDFVTRVSDRESTDYVRPADRIAVFDNDGNLWSEQPVYFQLIFALDRIKDLAPEHPEWESDPLLEAALRGDMETVAGYGERGLLRLIMLSHAGMTTDEFAEVVEEWLKSSSHPRFKKPYNQLIYQPMLELLQYLRSNGFKTFIVSGGGIEFMRVWAEEAYGIPPDQVIGSSIKTELDTIDGKLMISRLAELDFIDDKAGKPVGIQKFTGKRPIFASGNSDGDLHMIRWTTEGNGARFGLYLHHTDSVREWAYDRNSHIGRLDKGLDAAKELDWTVINMARDWKIIYPFEQKDTNN